ncbi:rhodanese-like domain-containing protein [uncultured Paracoccus sp.]|uniref:sulfurtransferase n=1 Tax=uncultured Paracoccus sp. TaxID=189685 RepID=UPI0025DB3E1C|nr:rhodanese-like domain-containing protein [uncultured Paracoccus sp.]
MTLISASEAIAAPQGTVFVDTRPQEDWAKTTIPGAISLNVYDYFIRRSDEDGIAAMVAGARAAFRQLGLDRAPLVVFFEDATGMRSPRGLWFHELCGLDGGRILDGGLVAWQAAGGATAPGSGATGAIADGDPAQAGSFRREMVATTAELLEPRAPNLHILDARRPAEWDGSYVHACCARAGRIPGADLLFYEDLLQDGRYRSPQEIRRIAAEAGFTPAQRIVTYCHRGARAATALYGLRSAGFDNLAIHPGSWHEWAGEADLPAVEGPGTFVHR